MKNAFLEFTSMKKREVKKIAKGIDEKARIAEFFLCRSAHKTCGIGIGVILVSLALVVTYVGLR